MPKMCLYINHTTRVQSANTLSEVSFKSVLNVGFKPLWLICWPIIKNTIVATTSI